MNIPKIELISRPDYACSAKKVRGHDQKIPNHILQTNPRHREEK